MAMQVVLVAFAAFVVVTVEAGNYCCAPRQWEGYQGIYAGASAEKYSKLETGHIKLSVDVDRQMVAGDAYFIRNGRPYHFRYIRDFKNKRRYVLSGDSCLIKKMDRPFFEGCIPDHAIETGAFTFGMNENSVKAQYFSLKVPDCHGHILYIATVAPIPSRKNENVCVPISETSLGYYYGNDGPVKFLDDIGYTNITSGIADAKVFDIPPQCHPKSVQDYWLMEDFNLETEAFFGI